MPVPGAEAIRMSNELATKEGIFVGITSGATFAGALKIAAEAPKGSTILAMLPDTGERYLSTPLFANVPADMTAEEMEISRSTPRPSSQAEREAASPCRPNLARMGDARGAGAAGRSGLQARQRGTRSSIAFGTT